MKKIMSIALIVMIFVSLTACQSIEDFKGGLAHITGTETEPPSMFTPTVTPEAESKTETEPVVAPAINDVEQTDNTSDALASNEDCQNCRDNPTHRNTDKQAIAVGKEHYEKNYRNYQFNEKDIENYRYAFFIDSSEISTANGFPTEYTFDGAPYNMHAADSGESDLTQYKSNKELLEEYGNNKVEKYAVMASKFMDAYMAYDPQKPSSELEQEYTDLGVVPELAKILSERERIDSSDTWFKQNAVTIYYNNYVYRAGNGNIRSRILCYLRLTDASEKFFEKNPEQKLTLNEWHSHSYEVEMWLDENEKMYEYAINEISEPISVTPEEKAMLNSLKF